MTRQRNAGDQGISEASVEIVGKDGFQGMPVRRVVIPINATPDGSEQDTNFDVPNLGALLPMVGINVRVEEQGGGTKTLDVGTLSTETGGDADGLVAAIDVSNVGLVFASLANGAETLGALLKEAGAGGNVPFPFAHIAGRAKSVSFTAGSNDWTTFRGDIILFVMDPVGA